MNKVVEIATRVEACPHDVWSAMTASDTALFPGTHVETDWEVGHPISFTGTWKGKPYRDRGEIQECTPDRKLAFTHWSQMSGTQDRPENYHTVSYELEPAGRGTRVTLSQYNHGSERPDAKTTAEYTKNWEMMLDNLKQVVESRH